MQQVLAFLDDLWNIKWVKGHRTKIGKACLWLISSALIYQGAATNEGLIAGGLDLPDLSNQLIGSLGVLSAYFAKKLAQFAKEHAT